jgi:quinol monooxygenase YgiN
MIEFHIRLKIRESKGPEIRQALKSLGRMIRARSGCKRYSFYVRSRDRKGTVIQVWDGRATLNTYLRSHEHKVLLGAISTLCSGCTIQFRGCATGVPQ